MDGVEARVRGFGARLLVEALELAHHRDAARLLALGGVELAGVAGQLGGAVVRH